VPKERETSDRIFIFGVEAVTAALAENEGRLRHPAEMTPHQAQAFGWPLTCHRF